MSDAGIKAMLVFGTVLVLLWLLALIVFKIVGFAIHLLLIAGLLMVIWAMVRRGASAVRRRL